MEMWERAVRDRGRILLEREGLALVRVEDGEVVRVGAPPMIRWGGWRYGDALPILAQPRRGWIRRLLEGLPPLPLEGYDPYGLTGPLGGIARGGQAARWIGSPFIARAHPLVMVFAAVPLAPECPACRGPLLLDPWAFHTVTFVVLPAAEAPDGLGVEVPCGACGTRVTLPLDAIRPALRLGLSVLDPADAMRPVGEAAGAGLDTVGGPQRLLEGLARIRASLGDLEPRERVALAIALDARAEGEALEAEWRRAEEIIGILGQELTEAPGFETFRQRILDEGLPK
jgi:hypothetical protein